MAVTDPIADYLTRIRNALKAKKSIVDIPASNLKKALSKILMDEHYISDYFIIDDGLQGVIRIKLKYDDDKPVIEGLKRVSKPGLRKYVGVQNIPRVLNNLGMAILTTPIGVITNKEARRRHVGGEVLCIVW
ncbi:30S ribosomal protein S8 [candidate division KSB1 bacterium]|nr:30S ribosomal protein S8 [candidate division KSB1 bacterium]MCH8287251.1 30S ribosomal protein S8 [candidate division KSB1 bacterium]